MEDPLDPLDVPVRDAATVMIIDDRPELEVLLVHRTDRVVFGPGTWVFPGGRVDAADQPERNDSICAGLSDTEASTVLGVEGGGLAWWIAAARETLEESGILLAAHPVDADVVATIRSQVLADEGRFVDLLVEHGIELDASRIEEVARFITPVGPPRRFDARFFIARAPEGQVASHDDGEIVNHRWIRPADALDAWRAGEMDMMTPTVRMIACLERYASADDVLAAAASRLDYKRVRVEDPQGEYRILLPGEPGYETAELEVESGWVRLWDDTL